MLLSPFVYSKAPFKHCKRALTVFPFCSKINQTYREEDPFLHFSTQGKQVPSITVLSMFYSRSYCNLINFRK